ncbi:pectin lyase-like protein [Periconia macrospinosa]|uniref:Pectin lyase-like protein n=1 Tax=Periconia macrospinosa TaxID=97972 RepID=A0A2V1DIU4_9PLEO|nr:pectin lyase-like protein [Periconia macrospinosa]
MFKHLLAFAVICKHLVALAATDFYVAPNGSDNNAGTSASQAFQTLPKAQQAVRSQLAGGGSSSNITVHVGSGTYTLSTPLIFTAADSGKNGATVKWTGSDALISGGYKVTNWTATGTNGIYTANVPVGTQSRNLYVNGKASNYARKKIANRKDLQYTSTSIKWTSSAYDWITSTKGIEGAEVRFINSFADRVAPVQAVAGTRELVMRQNTWFNQNWGYDTISKPNADFGVWVQNALALLSDGGQFYLDSKAGKVYYKPLNGEDMRTAQTYLGVLETLVVLGGTYDSPVHDIVFENLSFHKKQAHSTWLQPSSIGYIDQQTGGNICENKTYDQSNFESTRPWWCQMPSAIQISAATNILLTGGNYTQLGGGGVGIGNDANAHLTGVGLGANNISLRNGYFTQVMGNSITAGGLRADAHHPSNPRMLNTHLTISGNIFYNVSTLFSSTVPILATYVQQTSITHNDIYLTPYSGICLGYGWGSNDAGGSSEYVNRGLYKYQPQYTTPTTMSNNLITGNLIHAYGYSHTDLGAIYTLSKSPASYIENNYAYDSNVGFGVYTDEGSNSYLIRNNVLLSGNQWYAQNGVNTANNTIQGNFGRTGRQIAGNTLVSGIEQVSSEARKWASDAGVLPGERGGRPVSNGKV